MFPMSCLEIHFTPYCCLSGAIISVKKEAEKKAEHLQAKVDTLMEENKKLREQLGEAKVRHSIGLWIYKNLPPDRHVYLDNTLFVLLAMWL